MMQQNSHRKDFSDVYELLFGGDAPMTTPTLLYSGAHACSQTCDATKEDCAPSLPSEDDDPEAPLCLSSVTVCDWNKYDTVPWVENDACPNDMFKPWWCQTRCRPFHDEDCTVPYTYLGGGIWK